MEHQCAFKARPNDRREITPITNSQTKFYESVGILLLKGTFNLDWSRAKGAAQMIDPHSLPLKTQLRRIRVQNRPPCGVIAPNKSIRYL